MEIQRLFQIAGSERRLFTNSEPYIYLRASFDVFENTKLSQVLMPLIHYTTYEVSNQNPRSGKSDFCTLPM